MKKLLFLLVFIPIVSFGQERVNEYDIYPTSHTEKQEKVVVQSKTNLSNKTIVPRELILSEQKTTIKTPLTADLSNYTDLLLVDINLSTGLRGTKFSKYGHDIGFKNYYGFVKVKDMLALSVFEVINPIEFNKKRFRKEPLYLKSIKKESNLYMYINQSQGRGDDINTSFIIRDWKNKIIYNATHINTGLNEILAPLIDY